MVNKSFVPFTAMLTTVLLLTHTGLSFARSLSSLDDSYWLDSIDKRNSWWSKKSVDDFNRISQQGDSIEESPRDSDSANLYGCYVENCVPEFIECSRATTNKQFFTACKLQHRACAKQCWTMSSPDQL